MRERLANAQSGRGWGWSAARLRASRRRCLQILIRCQDLDGSNITFQITIKTAYLYIMFSNSIDPILPIQNLQLLLQIVPRRIRTGRLHVSPRFPSLHANIIHRQFPIQPEDFDPLSLSF